MGNDPDDGYGRCRRCHRHIGPPHPPSTHAEDCLHYEPFDPAAERRERVRADFEWMVGGRLVEPDVRPDAGGKR